MDKVVDNMINFLDLKSNGSIINIKEVFQCLSLDIIANCAFGIETDSFKNPSNELFQTTLQTFTDLRISDMGGNILFQILMRFPFLYGFIDGYGKKSYSYLKNVTKDIVENRQVPRGDFIDRLKGKSLLELWVTTFLPD